MSSRRKKDQVRPPRRCELTRQDDAEWTHEKRVGAPRKPRPRRAPLDGLLSKLPDEIIELAFEHLSLESLLTLCHLSKAFARFMLVDRDSLWTRKLSEMGLPIPDFIRPLARYANLVTGHSCTSCGQRTVERRRWYGGSTRRFARRQDFYALRFTLQVAMCRDCFKNSPCVMQDRPR